MPGRPAGSPATLARRARSVRAAAAAVLVVLAAGVAGALVVGGRTVTPGAAGSVGTAPPPSRAPSAPTSAPAPAVPAGQAVVTGTVTSATAQDATAQDAAGPPLSTPLEITVPVRGRGGATFYNVDVGGRPSAVVWNGGEPLGLIGHGAIEAGRVDVTVDASGSTWALDGAERILAPGTYHAAAPVAVGQAGLARPQDSADFTAGSSSVVVTSGGATVHRDPRALHLVGPGALVLNGTLQVRTSSGTATVHRIVLARGSFDLTLTPGAGGLSVQAAIRGPVTTG